jgi:cytochrome b561
MGIKGNSVRYGSIAIAIHWVSAMAILALLGTGFAASLAAEPQEADILRIHAPLGILVVVLTLMRIVWRFVDARPEDPAGQPRWQALAARGVHALLYLVILIMGASGIGLVVLSGAAAILFFGAAGPLPDFAAFTPMAAHAAAAFVLLAFVCLHVGAALYHQLVRRDQLLSRMGIGPTA